MPDWYLSGMDNVFLGIYILELLLKFYVHRRQFFDSGWNNFGEALSTTNLATKTNVAVSAAAVYVGSCDAIGSSSSGLCCSYLLQICLL